MHRVVDPAACLRRSDEGNMADDLFRLAKETHVFYPAGAYVAQFGESGWGYQMKGRLGGGCWWGCKG